MFKALKELFKDINENFLKDRKFFVHAEHLGIYSQVIVWELKNSELEEFGKTIVDREDICTNDDILKYAQNILARAKVSAYTVRVF